MAITLESKWDVSIGSRIRVLKLDGIDLAEIAANTSAEQDLALPTGTVAATDLPISFVLPSANAGIIVGQIRVKAADTLSVVLINATGSAVDAAAKNDGYLVILSQG